MEKNQWEQLLWRLMSMNNLERNQAESVFSELKKNQCDVTLLGLIEVIGSHTSEPHLRGLAAVLLRRVLLRDEISLWPNASIEIQTRVKQILLQVLYEEKNESNRSLRRKVCDIVGELASSILEDGQWDELLPTLFQWIQTPGNIVLKETTLRVFEMISIHLANVFTEGGQDDINNNKYNTMQQVYFQMIQQSLQDPNGRISLNAIRAYCMLLMNLDNTYNTFFFSSLVQINNHTLMPLILQAMHHMLYQRKHYEQVQEVLEVLIEVMEPHAILFKKNLKPFVETCVQMADDTNCHIKNTILPDGTRQLAMEFLVSCGEFASSTCRKMTCFVNLVYPVCFRMMLELTTEKDSWSVTNWEKEEEEEKEAMGSDISNFDVGSEALERLVLAIGPKKSLPKCFELIQHYASHKDNWLYRHASLVGLCQILESLQVDTKKDLTPIVDHLLIQCHDIHPRVCCTSIDVIGQLAMDQAPMFQQFYHQEIVSVLLHFLSPQEYMERPRLQAHAATSLRQFMDMCPPQLIVPYMDEILQALLHILQNPQIPPKSTRHCVRMVKEQVIAALSSIATCAGASFTIYYTSVVSALKQLLLEALQEILVGVSSSTSTTTILLPWTFCGVTLECLSLIGLAVGKEIFAKDAQELMETMAQMQNTPQIASNELVRTYLLQAWGRMGKCFGKEFENFLPLVMPSLMAAASQQAEFELPQGYQDEDEDDGGSNSQDEDVEIAHVNDKTVSIRTSIMEEKTAACQLLVGIISDAQETFFPYVEQVTHLFAPLMTDSVYSDIRSTSISAMPALVHCVSLHALAKQQQDNKPIDLQPVKQMLDFALGRLLNALSSEPEVDLVMGLIQSMKQCIENAMSPWTDPLATSNLYLNEAQLTQLVQGLLLVLADSFQRRALRRAEKSVEDLEDADVLANTPTDDSDDTDTASESDAEALEAELHLIMADCIGFLAKSHGEHFFGVFQTTLWEKMLEMCAPHCLLEDRKLALYIIDDVLEHCGAPAMAQMDIFLPLLMESVSTSEGYPPLIQAACYGIGVCARLGPQQLFSKYTNASLELLTSIMSHPMAQDSMMMNAVDNAISSYGLVCDFQVTNASQLFTQWLQMLPLRGDLEESVEVTKRLCQYVRTRDERVLGVNSTCNIVLIVKILAEVIAHIDSFSCIGESNQEALQQEIAMALKTLRAMLPEQVMQQTWTTLSPIQQTALHGLFAAGN